MLNIDHVQIYSFWMFAHFDFDKFLHPSSPILHVPEIVKYLLRFNSYKQGKYILERTLVPKLPILFLTKVLLFDYRVKVWLDFRICTKVVMRV